MTKIAAKIQWVVMTPAVVPIANPVMASDCTTWQICTIRRRLKRSATWPTTKASRRPGMNSAKPTMPSAKALPVIP